MTIIIASHINKSEYNYTVQLAVYTFNINAWREDKMSTEDQRGMMMKWVSLAIQQLNSTKLHVLPDIDSYVTMYDDIKEYFTK